MNMLDGDFGFGSSPPYPKANEPRRNNMTSDAISRKSNRSAKKDDFDDLLQDLLLKEDKKAARKKQRQSVAPYSSTQIDFHYPPQPDFKKTTEKWSTPNIDFNPLKDESPKFRNSRLNSNDDKSEDGRSFKSAFTKPQPFQFDNLMTLRQASPKHDRRGGGDEPIIPERSSRMRPPLAKNASRDQLSRQPKEPSVLNDDVSVKFSRGAPQTSINFDLIPIERGRSKQSQVQQKPKERIIEREKVVTIRQEATQLKKQFDAELSEIRKSYERQLNDTRAKIQEQMNEAAKNKTKLIRQYELRIQEERIRLNRIHQENTARMKDMHQWQLKKKEETYQLEIEKLRSLTRMDDHIQQHSTSIKMQGQLAQLKSKQRQLQMQKRKLQTFRYQLQQKQQNLKFQDDNFQLHRKKEQQRLQQQRRTLLEKENHIKMKELEERRLMAHEKQQNASELANSELEIIRKKEALHLEQEELRMTRQLLQKEKSQFEQFNRNIMQDYKMKLKQLQSEKEKVNQLQIELYKKIHTVQVVDQARQRASTPAVQRQARTSTNYAQNISMNQENKRNRANTQVVDMVHQTKERFRDVEMQVRRNAVQLEMDRYPRRDKMNVEGYITRMNRAMSRH